MKFKGCWVVLVAGLIYLPSISYGQDDLSAERQKAERGDAEAQNYLGTSYGNGYGVTQDSKEAVKWFRLVAEQGGAPAQLRLGLLYYNGYGVPQDYVQAYAWINIAAAQGGGATAFRTILLKEMTPTQIEEGQRLSREYAEKFGKK